MHASEEIALDVLNSTFRETYVNKTEIETLHLGKVLFVNTTCGPPNGRSTQL